MENLTFNHGVEGSSPSALTMSILAPLFSLKNFAELANRQPRLATYCSLFDQYRHAVARHPRLICGLGIALDLGQRLVAGDGRDHVGAASSFGQTTSSGLAQTMGACPLRQAGRVAGFAKPIGEACRHERLAECRRQERQ